MGRADADNAELHNSELAAPKEVSPGEVLELAELWTLVTAVFGAAPSMTPEWTHRLALEVRRRNAEVAMLERVREQLESQLNNERRQRAVIEAELAEVVVVAQSIAASDADSQGSLLIEAIEIAEAAGRRGLLTNRERQSLRALRRAVPS